MDSYPGDLLAGVFPLVFAVDAILPRPMEPVVKEEEENQTEETQEEEEEGRNEHGEVAKQQSSMMQESSEPQSTTTTTTPKASRRKNRSVFDRVLDAVAASLADEEEDDPLQSSEKNNRSDTLASLLTPGGRNASLSGNGDDSDSSFDDEEASLPSAASSTRNRNPFRVAKIASPRPGSNQHNTNNSSGNNNMSSPSFQSTKLNRFSVLRGSATGAMTQTTTTMTVDSTAYARALRMDGQGFFQQARILSISTQHGFPPSKDPEGTRNRPALLSQARAVAGAAVREFRTSAILQNQPIDGILPAGWLEKHVHALPSVLIVVTTLSGNNKEHQRKQDQHLLDTIRHLRSSSASKRDCRIHLVCVSTNEKASVLETDGWLINIQTKCQLLPSAVTILYTLEDLNGAESPGMPTSPSIRKLHRNVRDASLAYYMTQARRAKRKHTLLGHESQPALLPLAVRYCFKIGVFYEFQLKHEKSTKYFAQAYRYLEKYYQYLQRQGSKGMIAKGSNPQGDDGMELTNMSPSDTTASSRDDESGEEGVEVPLENDAARDTTVNTEDNTQAPAKSGLEIPPDMAHQCRNVASWLNFKLLQAGFLSAAFASSDAGSNGGLVAASAQWRTHCRVFLSKVEETNPVWNHWSYVAHQRLVMAQLAERYPPRESSLTGLTEQMHDEVKFRCDPWRNYESAAEAQLKLGVCLERENKLKQSTKQESTSDSEKEEAQQQGHRRFVGGIDSEGLEPRFIQESALNHKDSALQMVLHAISILESEQQQQASPPVAPDLENTKTKDEEQEKKVNRAASRLYYLAGGILLGMKRYKEATPNLETALSHCLGWNQLELAVRKLLIECYENHMPSKDEVSTEQTKNVASMILDSYFSTQMSSLDLGRALDNFSTLSDDDGVMKWHHESADETDTSLPFWFTVTFPDATHATAGDVVTASIAIKSNLDYAVHVNVVTLLSMAGPITVPPSALLRARNASEGSDGGIIIQAQSSIYISTQIHVPKDLGAIASDVSGNGGEAQGTPGKGSFAKSARPRTAGMTSAGGVRFLSEMSTDGSGQWSTHCLGGKPLRCDGLQLKCTPVHVEKAAANGAVERINMIDVTIVHKKPKTQAPMKRTPFEEDNYVSSAWLRPNHLPFELGPRCLRVLSPMSQMVITDLTNPATRGKAMEGTVNRVLLKLEAGQKEKCHDIKYKINCTTTLVSIDGTTTNPATDIDDDNRDRETIKEQRIPVLVASDETMQDNEKSRYEYDLPRGWKLVGSGQNSNDEMTAERANLDPGETSYIYFDIYRPPAVITEDGGDICQTDFDVSISYKQSRPFAQGRQKSRQSPPTPIKGDEEFDFYDKVFLEHSASVTWTSPLSADFSGGMKKGYPSGSSHPSNQCPSENDQTNDKTDSSFRDGVSSEMALIDGEKAVARCSLCADSAKDGLSAEIVEVLFEDRDGTSKDTENGYSMRLISGGGKKLLYESMPGKLGSKLRTGAKFGLSYTVQAELKNQTTNQSIKGCLGVVCVKWLPIAIADVATGAEGQFLRHGPLVIEDTPRIRFRGPTCSIEHAPFETTLDALPPCPRLALPFEIRYQIKNKTELHQKLQVAVQESGTDDGMGERLLLSGLVNGDICLAPFETQCVAYTALATRAGKTNMPAISVSSVRYKTWVIKEGSNEIFVVP